MKTLIFRDGNLMPALGLGTWKAKGKELKSAVKTAIRVGYRHIDTAAVYGNEEVIGEALAEILKKEQFNERTSSLPQNSGTIPTTQTMLSQR